MFDEPFEAMCQTANAKKIVCHDCIYRDKTSINLDGETIEVGITKANCLMYTDHVGKPGSILYMNGPCQYYAKDKTAR